MDTRDELKAQAHADSQRTAALHRGEPVDSLDSQPERDTYIEGFLDELYAVAMRHPYVELPHIRTDRDSIERWADSAPTRQLIAGLLSPSADVRSMAATYLREAWMSGAPMQAPAPLSDPLASFPQLRKVAA